VWLPDGRLAVCYLSGDTAVRVAIKDSVWLYETVGSSGRTSPTIAVGPRGTVGVVHDSGGICYAERSETGWDIGHLPDAGGAPSLAYDTTDGPLVTSIVSSGKSEVIVYAQSRPDWLAKVIYMSSYGYPVEGSYAPPRFDRHNRAYVFVSDYWWIFPQVWGADLAIVSGRGDTWQVVRDSSLPEYEPAQSLALDTAGKPAWCFTNYWGGLYFEDQFVDSAASPASAWFDALNRPQIAYVTDYSPSGRLKYAYLRGGTWLSFNLPDTSAVSDCDLLLDTLCQPIIAYLRSGGGLFIARGVDIVGQSEAQREPTAIDRQLTASVIRNVLLLPEAPSLRPQATSWLMDASGRKVLDLKAGANDVNGLSPGVYFVREAQAQAVRKIVVTR
jgi:hypothetical protein